MKKISKNKKNKIKKVKEITDKISKSKNLVIVNYSGLAVKQIQSLKIILKELNAEMKVYKNRLFKISIAGTKLEKMSDFLTMQNAFVFTKEKDNVPVIKALADFKKKNNALELKVATYENKIIYDEELVQISLLPSYEEGLRRLAFALIMPLYKLGLGLKEYSQTKN